LIHRALSGLSVLSGEQKEPVEEGLDLVILYQLWVSTKRILELLNSSQFDFCCHQQFFVVLRPFSQVVGEWLENQNQIDSISIVLAPPYSLTAYF